MLRTDLQKIKDNLARVIIGKDEILELLLVGLLAEGHVLIEDVPGVGKTSLAKALAAVLGCDFSRLQCTPDLMPTDVTGFFIYDRRSQDFSFRPGPVLTNILLVDEINRAVPRTQSSLLEAMEEHQVTVDGQTFQLPWPFLVMATQNPIEMEGTFPLPEAQLDRFLLKISLGYPGQGDEEKILSTHGAQNPLLSLQATCAKEEVLQWQERCRSVYVQESVGSYIVSLVRATREHSAVALGASPRAGLALLRAAKALALLDGRDFVLPDDVKKLACPVLEHRLILTREERLRGTSNHDVLAELLDTVPVPLEDSVKQQ